MDRNAQRRNKENLKNELALVFSSWRTLRYSDEMRICDAGGDDAFGDFKKSDTWGIKGLLDVHVIYIIEALITVS